VNAAQLTGVDEQQKVNIVVFIVKGKIDAQSSRFKNIHPGEWIYYRSWLVLKSHASFLLPKAKEPVVFDPVVFEKEQVDATPQDGDVFQTERAQVATTDCASTSEQSNYSSLLVATVRGPGPGRKKSKDLETQAKYRKDKMSTLKEIC
jgi:hypothetical protein